MQHNFGKAPARAPLRWAGSKRKSLAALKARVPSCMNHYIEPFAGSACFVFETRPEKVTLGDINAPLIDFYHHLRESPEELYLAYSQLPINTEYYYYVRSIFNEEENTLRRSAHFLYLNRLCFNGIYRVNRKGHFNVPWGGDKVGKPLSLEDLSGASEAIQGASFVCSDFEEVVRKNIEPGCLVYLDPPYASDEVRVFKEYHVNSFSTGDWERLLRLLIDIDKAGAKFLLSYAGDSVLRDRLGRWSVSDFEVTRNVGGFKASRRKYGEFLASNFECQEQSELLS
jgi:DNA adenine methylase